MISERSGIAETNRPPNAVTCVEPGCVEPATEAFIGHKKGREPLTFRTCREHKFPMSLGLIRFGLADEIEYDKEHADAT